MDKLNDFDEIDDEEVIVTIIDEDGIEQDYIIIDTVSHKGSNYMLVTPADEDEDSESFEAGIIKETGEEGDEMLYSLVDNENEFNEVAALFMENEDDYDIEL